MEDILTRKMPQAIDAEQSVLGSILVDARCVPEVVSVLQPSDFYNSLHKDMYKAIYDMFSKSETIDPVTVIDTLRARGHNDENLIDFVKELMDITPTAVHAKQYAEIVHEKAVLRGLIEAAARVQDLAFAGEGETEEIVGTSEKLIFSALHGQTLDSMEDINSVLMRVNDHLNELAASGSEISGLSTGLIDLDKKINGLNKTDLVLIAGRPGMGKTSLGLNIALNVAKKNLDKAVAFFSLEMSSEQLVTRLISSECYIDSKLLSTGKLDDAGWSKVSLASAALSTTKIRIDDNPSITVAGMSAACRRIPNLALIVVDYIQLISSDNGSGKKFENRVQAISEITRSLKIMAKELKVPVICMSQLSRDCEKRSDKRPMLSDLRESGSIEQDADEVIFLYRDGYYNENAENPNVAECIVAKNRHGETGTVKLSWLPSFTSFENLDWKH